MQRIFFFILVFAFSASQAQILDVGLFRNAPIYSIMISPSTGEYCIKGDTTDLGKLVKGNYMKVEYDTAGVRVVTLNGYLGTFKKVSLSCSDSLSDLKLKGMFPVTKEKQLNGDFSVRILNKSLLALNHVDVEEYVSGVVESESGHGHKMEFYKVQTIISRTYALANIHKHEAEGFHLCDQVHCQAYKNKCKTNMTIHEAAMLTHGTVIVDDSLKLISATFHSNCGGQTASSEQVWGKALPYLRSVKDPYCVSQTNAYWSKEISKTQWLAYLKKNNFPVSDSSCIENCTNFSQNYRMSHLSSCDRSLHLKNIRTDFKLKSAYFSVQPVNETTLVIKGRGFGHGVGLCQEGAMKMAKLGFDHKTILEHYFTGIHIVNISTIEEFAEE
ncbi:MAG: SpoIID/LytB domain-containing protein [Bacteroidota bacterium]